MFIFTSNNSSKNKKEDINTSEVKLSVIGTGAAGKTYLLNAIHNLIMKGMGGLKNGLRIGSLGAYETTLGSIKIEDNIEAMKSSALISTDEKYDFEFQLFHKVKPIVKITYHDNVGQILTHNTESINSMRSKFIDDIKKSEIVWILLPAQVDQNGQYLGSISGKDIALAEGYLQEALQDRPSNFPLVLAILLTKADVLGLDGNGQNEFVKIKDGLADRFDWLISCDFLSSAAFFPISAMGFDNTRLAGMEERGCPIYLLSGDDLKPYNINKLLLWSLASVAYQNKLLKLDETVKKNLASSLQNMEGLVYPLKEKESY